MKVVNQTESSREDVKNNLKFLWRDEIDLLLAKVLKEFDRFSHEEVSSAYNLIKYLSRKANRPFTPYYDAGHSLNNQVGKGWVQQIKLLPQLFIYKSGDSFFEIIEKKVRDIYCEKYEAFDEIINGIKTADDKKSCLRNMELAVIAYQLPEDLKLEYLTKYGIDLDPSQAHDFLLEIDNYVKKCNMANL